jgi:CheY-like chemotaxis protein
MRPATRVLVVDDNPINIEIVTEALEDDFQILPASNADEALELVERFQPRIVLLDVMLPGMDGYELCRRIRTAPGMLSARIVMVTAKAMPSEESFGYDAGADAYVTKPFEDVDLLSAMRSGRY